MTKISLDSIVDNFARFISVYVEYDPRTLDDNCVFYLCPKTNTIRVCDNYHEIKWITKYWIALSYLEHTKIIVEGVNGYYLPDETKLRTHLKIYWEDDI